ncbi:hypothetical protein GHT06_003716 [Daphnia sinensis]|uniref:DUF11 domain-containing protein n=1 Tax=Daphnia sinensis TaxID=1820382 RepID=A0AAD5KTN6_9CRUS|nr:hypothetical protein GHT06_003716 [Daphnia sinensis]
MNPGEEITLKTNFRVEQIHLDLGQITDEASATIQFEGESIQKVGSKTVFGTQNPKISISEESKNNSFQVLGEKIQFTINVKNIGNVTLNNILIEDPLTGFSNVISSLAPQMTQSFSTEYQANEKDLNSGKVENIVTSSFVFGGGNYKFSDSLTVNYVPFIPSILVMEDDFVENPINILENRIAGNVLLNDTLHGLPIKAQNVEIFVVENGGLVDIRIDPNGDLILPEGTPAGTYLIRYKLLFHGVHLRILDGVNSFNLYEGDQFEYLIKIENNGNTAASKLEAKINLPEGLMFISSNSIQRNVVAKITNGEIRWEIGELETGDYVDLLLKLKALPLLNGTTKSFQQTASVSSAESELSVNDNSKSYVVVVKPFFIPNLITPNGDGKNDRFEIKGFARFISIELRVFNRWGDLVFNQVNYDNNWSAEGLSEGTYFYVLKALDADVPASIWGIALKFESNTGIWNGGTPTAADLNGDDISDLLVPASDNSGYFVYAGNGSNSTTATKRYVINTSSTRSVQPAIANIITATASPEVIMVNSAGFVYIFNNIGGSETNFLFKSTTASQYTSNVTPYIVDIDQDGTAEIVLGSDIFGIVNGALVKRVAGTNLNYVGATSGDTGTAIDVVVVDIIASNPGKELVYGSRVYAVNLSSGNMSILKDLSTIAGSGAAAGDNGPTAVADMDLDGDLDIVYNGSTNVYIWDPNQSLVLFRRIPPAFNFGVRGLPLIANVYNERANNGRAKDLPEAIIVNSLNSGAGIVTAYNLNFTTALGSTNQFVWSINTNDMSGSTGVTAFDFDGNGIREIVYRDQSTLRIINGNLAVPVNYVNIPAASSTWGTCPNLTVSASISNSGAAALPAGVYVSLYDADPTSGQANLIGSAQTTASIAQQYFAQEQVFMQ